MVATVGMLVGQGVTITEDDDNVVITFKKDARFGLSASQKSVIVASTKGNVTLPNGITVGLNAYVK